MLKLITIVLLLSSLNGFAGDTIFPPIVSISPDSIDTNTEVLAGVDINRCFIPSEDSYVEIDGNNIQFVFIASFFTPCTVIPVADYFYYNLGTLPEGDYTITFYDAVEGGLPVEPNDPNVTLSQFGDPISFGVVAAGGGNAVSVPSLNIWGLLIMFIVFALAILYATKKKNFSMVLLILIFFNFQADASVYHVLLSGDSNAPTADEVHAESLISPAPPSPVLASFVKARPQKVETLVSIRVTGHFLDVINNNPEWSYSKLYRYVVLTYPEGTDEQSTRDTLLSDQYIDDVFLIDSDPSIVPLRTPSGDELDPQTRTTENNSFGANSHLTDLNIIAAWELSEGSGYIGAVDVGIQVDHPCFRAFDDNGDYLGGNLLEAFYQYDIGEGDLNIDSAEPTPTTGTNIDEGCDLADGDNDNMAVPTFTGHGTHMAGLMVAKNGSVSGICKNCGLGMVKFYFHNRCLFLGPPISEYWWMIPRLAPNSPELAEFEQKIADGISILSNTGMGVTNYSGGRELSEVDYCQSNPNYPLCLAIKHADEQNVLIVGANGNNRTTLQLPAADPRTVAVGGLHDNGNYWNESPLNGDYTLNGTTANCPYSDGGECGSNKSYTTGNGKTDTISQARSMYSTFYQGGRHNHLLGDTSCTDAMDGIPNDGYGLCTGTSMSSPQIASIMQLIRSTHPLLPNGNSDPASMDGIKNVLNFSSSRNQNGLAQNEFFGYGLPDARLALETVLGKSNGSTMKTRLTPMFVNHSTVAKNTMYTPFPQVSVAFLLANVVEYLPDTNAPLVSEFDEFWYGTTESFPSPRAAFYVFTTNNNPFINLKNMVPLRRMEKTVNGNDRNDTYAVSPEEIEDFHDEDYNYAGIEGYIFPTCLQEPGCIPANAQKLYRVVDTVDFNHTLVNLPINAPAPANSTKLGYVFPNIDTDGDGLIDGQERILGTSITIKDTDGDGLEDGEEYPAAGVPVSDPRISDIIFEDGFE